MADGVTVDNGTLTDFDVSTDEVNINAQGVKHVQYFKLADGANGGTDPIGGDAANGLDVDVTRVIPGTSANHLGKAEDAAAASGDTGVALLAVRKDAPASLVSADGDYANPLVSDQGQLWVVQARPKRTQVASSGLTTAATAYSADDQVGDLFTFTNQALASGGGGYIESIMLNDETKIIGTYTVWLFRASVTLAADNAAFSLSDGDAQLLIGDPITLGPVRSANNSYVCGWYGSIPYDCSGGTSLYAALQTNGAHTFFGAVSSLKLTLSASVLG